MNRLLVGIRLLAIVCIAGSCTDEDEYTQGQWMKKASYNGVYRACLLYTSWHRGLP